MLSAIKLCPSRIRLEARGVSRNGERESIRPHEATCQDTDHVGSHRIDLGIPSGQVTHVEAEAADREQPCSHRRRAVECQW
jgi:hypothetical protein